MLECFVRLKDLGLVGFFLPDFYRAYDSDDSEHCSEQLPARTIIEFAIYNQKCSECYCESGEYEPTYVHTCNHTIAL